MVSWLNAADADHLRQVRDGHWDVVAVGSSFASMFFILGLPAGLRVLVLEKGPRHEHSELPALIGRLDEPLALDNRSGEAKRFVARSLFGGNSNYWSGQVPRFHPSDFELFERHGVGAPWPVRYDDLESYYVEVELLMEVAGGGTDHLLPRSAPFPYPPHAMTRADIISNRERPDIWVPNPTARSNGGSRPTCCSNLICEMCPIDAKFTILNGFPQFDRPDLTVMTGAEVRSVEFAAGAARGVVARGPGGEDLRVGADVVALGANAVFNAAILLRSGVTSPALGHYLHEEAAREILLDVAVPGLFGTSMISSLCYGAYDGSHRGEAAAVMIESHNYMLRPRRERGRWTDQMMLYLVADDLPLYENSVTLDADGEVRLTWTGHSAYGKAGLDRAEAMLPGLLPFAIDRVTQRREVDTQFHIQGTHRMGTDPERSVVDHSQRLHGHDSLFALGAGSFPTCSPANPTLTLSALSLRSGRSL